MKQSDRDSSLDALRCIAICLVVLYHLAQMSPLQSTVIRSIVSFGQYGVDLFFVLSGWLIGGLFWRERLLTGRVDLRRFWIRRWLRTLPPYFVALAISFGAVLIVRREPFRWEYLVFLQNYDERIPFFLVSWSLCIEEHFYLAAPLWFGLVAMFSPAWRWALLVALAPLTLRAFGYANASSEFGYWTTATHLRFEGLYLGFWLARLAIEERSTLFRSLRERSPLVLAGAIAAISVAMMSGGRLEYTLLYTALAVFFAALLVSAEGRSVPSVFGGPVRMLAQSSYSIYLMHPLGIHIGRVLCERLQLQSSLAYFALAVLASGTLSACMYFGVERTSLILRDRATPARVASKRPLAT